MATHDIDAIRNKHIYKTRLSYEQVMHKNRSSSKESVCIVLIGTRMGYGKVSIRLLWVNKTTKDSIKYCEEF